MAEKIITAYLLPEFNEGNPYIRIPAEADRSVATMRIDRETGKCITLWEEKLRYPYKVRQKTTLIVKTNVRTYKFPLKMYEDGTYIYNGSNIPDFFWSLLRISQHSPCGLIASLFHDNLLEFKQHFIDLARKQNKTMTVREFKALTTKIYEQLLINYGVCPIKARVMGFFINFWQFFNPDWRVVI